MCILNQGAVIEFLIHNELLCLHGKVGRWVDIFQVGKTLR